MRTKLRNRRSETKTKSSIRRLQVEQLELRQLLAADFCLAPTPAGLTDLLPWRNERSPVDVNHDSFKSPLDVLAVINDLNTNGSRKLGDFVPSELLNDHYFLDVDGDSFVTPLDALFVIDELNRESSGDGDTSLPTSSGMHCDLDLPTLAPRTVKVGSTVKVDLPISTVEGVPIEYEVAVNGLNQRDRTDLIALNLTYQASMDNYFGFGEKAFSNPSSGKFYFITDVGVLYETTWEGGPLETAGHRIIQLSETFYDAPTMLEAANLKLTEVHSTTTGFEVKTPPSIPGKYDFDFYGKSAGSYGNTRLSLNVVKNFAPTIGAIADVDMQTGRSVALDLNVSDEDGDPFSLAAEVDMPSARAYKLKQNWQLSSGNVLWTGGLDVEEKSFFATSGSRTTYFYILPNGDVHLSNGQSGPNSTVANTSLGLLAKLDSSYYDNINLLLDALPPPVTATISNNKLNVSAVEGFVGDFRILVSASDRWGKSEQIVHVNVTSPGPIDPSIFVSPSDGTVWKFEGTRLLRNGVGYLTGVSHYMKINNDEFLTDGWLNSSLPTDHLPFGIRHMTRNGWVVYEGSTSFMKMPSGEIFLWGNNLERLHNGTRTVLADNIAKIRADDDYLFALHKDGVLDRISLETMERSQLSSSVRDFGIQNGQVSLLKADGTSQEVQFNGDVEGFVSNVLAVDSRLNGIPPVLELPPGKGVIGATVAHVDSRLVGAVGRVLVSFTPGNFRFNGSGTILAYGGNKYVLTAAHVIEDSAYVKFNEANVRFDTVSSPFSTGTAANTVDYIYGREKFGGRDLALLRLHTAIPDVVGALLPEGTAVKGDKILIAGFGINNSGNDSTLSHGTATIDEVLGNVVTNNPQLGQGPLLVNNFKDGEAAIDHGDSGGPDLFAVASKDASGNTIWTPQVVGVHSFVNDVNGDNKTTVGEDTYSVSVDAAVRNAIYETIPPPVYVADITLKVTDDGDGGLAGVGEWQMSLVVNGVSKSIRRDYDDSNIVSATDVLWRVPVQNIGTLHIQFGGSELDSGPFNDDDPIAALDIRQTVPKTVLSPFSVQIGSGGGGTAYKMFVTFGMTWQ